VHTWKLAAAVGIVAALAVVCLPFILRQETGVQAEQRRFLTARLAARRTSKGDALQPLGPATGFVPRPPYPVTVGTYFEAREGDWRGRYLVTGVTDEGVLLRFRIRRDGGQEEGVVKLRWAE
jgi:hypothetical protein